MLVKVSKACTSLCQWVRAMHKYHFVAKNVAPKRAALAEANAELAESERILGEAKKRLQDVEEGIATLQAKLNECISKKEELERKTNECEQRLVRAGKLIGGLADEKDRWQSSVAVSSFFDKLSISGRELFQFVNLVSDAGRETEAIRWKRHDCRWLRCLSGNLHRKIPKRFTANVDQSAERIQGIKINLTRLWIRIPLFRASVLQMCL